MPRLYLVDASGYIFRAYYAIRPLSNSKGLPTNALFGFTSMLLKLIREEKPDYIGIVFDVARKTFRTEKFPEYKANRTEPPPDLVPQFPYFRKITRALNLPVLELPNYEADDVIGTVALSLARKNLETVIVTGDKDMMQLASDKVTLFDSMRDKRSGVAQVKERFGVAPELVPDVLGLAGDTSDNIPGVPGIGEKTAIKLITEYGSLEEVLKNASKIKGKMGEKIREFADQARLCKELATIVTNAPLEYDLKDFEKREADQDALKEIFTELEFQRFLRELAPEKKLGKNNYGLITTKEELKEYAETLKKAGRFAVDTETTAIDPMTANLVGVSFSHKEGDAVYIPVAHQLEGVKQLAWEEAKAILKPILEDPSLKKVAQNVKYDAIVLKRHGVELKGVSTDTMIASYLIQPDTNHNLDILSQTYLGHKTTTYKEVVGTGKKQKSFAEVPLDVARDYSCEDADLTLRLSEILLPKLKEEKLESVFEEIEMPLVSVLQRMEENGVKIDEKALGKSSKAYQERLCGIEAEVFKQAGVEFNLNSTKQLQEVLFEKMKLPVIRKTKTGYSTDIEVLTELAKNYSVPKLLIEYRSLSKLKSTYLDALPKLVNPETGRIHTSFNQTIAATGRLSSSDPNLQNIPVRTEEGKKIREAFIAEPGSTLISADYSQIELRVLAHIAEEPELIEAFEKDQDIHRAAAARIFGIAEGEVNEGQRAVGKTINFAVLYGQSPYGLSQQLGVPVEDAARYIENYYSRYGAVADYKEKILREVRKDKIVRTLFGRLRRFPDISSPNANIRAFAERTAFNTVFQGTAADIIKKAMIAIDAELAEKFPETRMIIQVHDELLFEVPEKDLKTISWMVKEKMENAVRLKVPLKVDINAGPTWAAAH